MSRGAKLVPCQKASVITIVLVLGLLILMVCAMFLTTRSGGWGSRPGQTLLPLGGGGGADPPFRGSM